MDFSEWIVEELDHRGWSRSEAARRGGISPSMFDKVINGYAKPGKKFLDGIALAFDLPPIVIYRKAGLLPPDAEVTPVVEQILYGVEDMPEIDQEEVLAFINMKNNLREQQKKKKK